MGNCICVTDMSGESYNKGRGRRRRSTVFHGDDDDDGEKLLLGETSDSSSCGRSTEIKIRMTKKELEELMRNITLKGLTAEEILSKLIFDGGDHIGFSAVDFTNHHLQRPWRPALQSIPEID